MGHKYLQQLRSQSLAPIRQTPICWRVIIHPIVPIGLLCGFGREA